MDKMSVYVGNCAGVVSPNVSFVVFSWQSDFGYSLGVHFFTKLEHSRYQHQFENLFSLTVLVF
jgi:hypothetical protein